MFCTTPGILGSQRLFACVYVRIIIPTMTSNIRNIMYVFYEGGDNGIS